MPTMKDWIKEQASGEAVEAIVFVEAAAYSWKTKGLTAFPRLKTVMTWQEALPFMEYEFQPGYGGLTCHCFIAWTASWVIKSDDYDGWQRPVRYPRSPAVYLRNVTEDFFG